MITEIVIIVAVLIALIVGFKKLDADNRSKWEKYIAANTKPADIDWSIDEWAYSPERMEAEARNEHK